MSCQSPEDVPEPSSSKSQQASAAAYNTTIEYSHPGAVPPIYIAGSMTIPAWTPLRMTSYKASAHTYLFTRTFESLSSGIYQYKFRLGEGDWWVLDEQSTVVPDGQGNMNNLLVVPQHPPTRANQLIGSSSSSTADSDKSASSYLDKAAPPVASIAIDSDPEDCERLRKSTCTPTPDSDFKETGSTTEGHTDAASNHLHLRPAVDDGGVDGDISHPQKGDLLQVHNTGDASIVRSDYKQDSEHQHSSHAKLDDPCTTSSPLILKESTAKPIEAQPARGIFQWIIALFRRLYNRLWACLK